MGINFNLKWPEPNTLLESTPPLNSPESTLPPRLPRSPLVESREPTDLDPAPSPSERSEDSRNPPSSSSESFLSRDSSERSPPSTRTTLDSNLPPSLPSRKPPRPTWLVSSRTPTSVPSTPEESPSCQRTCSSPRESEETDPERIVSIYLCTLILSH